MLRQLIKLRLILVCLLPYLGIAAAGARQNDQAKYEQHQHCLCHPSWYMDRTCVAHKEDYLLPLLALCFRFSLRAALPDFLPPPPGGFGIAGIPGAPAPACWRANCAHLPLPVLIWRIIVRISPNCSSSWLISCTVVPLPRAIRLRLLPLMISGLRLSSLVMDSTIASICFIWSPSSASSISGIAAILLKPGIISITCRNGPIRLSWRIALRKSSRSNLPCCSLAWAFNASSSSMVSCARSIKESTSPIPSIRDARRSG